jgi:hypothetical protein
MSSAASKYLIVGLVVVASLFAVTMPVLVWGSDKAPEFFGAFTAAIVAAVAVIIATYYQADLTRRRDALLKKEEEISDAVDLCFWLEHAANEMDFIARTLGGIRGNLIASGKTHIEMPTGQLREITSAKFFDELLSRAQAAARLPKEISRQIVRTIYATLTVSDRMLMLRGATDDFRPSIENIDRYLFVLGRRTQEFRSAAVLIENHLVSVGAMTSSTESHTQQSQD